MVLAGAANRAWLRACGDSAPGWRRRGRGCPYPALLALRSASGLGCPAWCGRLPRQRSTGLVRRAGRPGESCPRCPMGRSPTPGRARSPPHRGGRSGHPWRVRDGKGWSGRLRLVAGIVLAAGGDGGIPAGAVDDHGVEPAQQRGRARHAGLDASRAGMTVSPGIVPPDNETPDTSGAVRDLR